MLCAYVLSTSIHGYELNFEENDVISIGITDSPIQFGNVTVPFNKTLIIDPGVKISLDPLARILVYGTLIANGTNEKHV